LLTCGRPIPPALFYTDITNDLTSRAGDWQFGGKPYLPQKVCGQWKNATKTITGTTTFGTYNFAITVDTVTTLGQVKNYNGASWNFGSGSDPLPVDFLNPVPLGQDHDFKYGVEVAWNLDELNLDPLHTYRFQFTVHDGDQTKIGGDVGQACIIASSACPAGFAGPNCAQCDYLGGPDSTLLPDGSWTWYCFPTGQTAANNTYQLIKVPTSKLADPLYKNSGGFELGPSASLQDAQGYYMTCDCKRKVKTCPNNCCGNGDCLDQVGACNNCGNPDSLPDANCCPTINITQVCFNDGLYCSGNGRCVDGTCVCNPGVDGSADYAGAACNVTVVKKRACNTLPANDCQSCLDAAAASGSFCGWCTTGTIGQDSSLNTGACTEDSNCTPDFLGDPKNATQLSACLITTVYKPEPCPDNCTGHGQCVNQTSDPKADPNNSTNATLVCICDEGFTGENCGSVPEILNPIAIGAISAAAIAGIVVAIIAFLALAGGGAYAAAQAMGTGAAAPVVNNPLYRGDGNAGVNPLYKA
jgi:hypothetical protein